MTRRCKICAKSGTPFEAASLGEIKRHYAEMGHPTKSRKPKVPSEPEPEPDAESSLLADALTAFLSYAETVSPSGQQRVLDYLRDRFGTPAPVHACQRNVAEIQHA